MKTTIATLAIWLTATASWASPDGAANDLIVILAAEEPCSLSIDQSALGEFFVASGIDQESGLLAYIESVVRMKIDSGEEPSASSCTMARATAERIGILAE